ncbi:hypothetical protein [Bifidobacterium parmae]|nr:hypothetical protein [Bifidobacterium parmae]
MDYENVDDCLLADLHHDRAIDTGAKFIALSYRFKPRFDGYGWIPEDNPSLESYYCCLRKRFEDRCDAVDIEDREEMIDSMHWMAVPNRVYDMILHVVDPSCDSMHTWDHRYDFTAVDRLRILDRKPDRALLRHLLCAYNTRPMLYRMFENHYGWARPLLALPIGWRLRFGAELIEDMQSILDHGDMDGFRLETVSDRGVRLGVSYSVSSSEPAASAHDDAQAGIRWNGCEAMNRLLRGYGALSRYVCASCGIAVSSTADDELPRCVICRNGGRWFDRARQEEAVPMRDIVQAHADCGDVGMMPESGDCATSEPLLAHLLTAGPWPLPDE